ncbi:hypothetical protein [Nostoc sp.]|uniref:hypothetical protein n=1 Tax=Nostoc sp. TaxID=1180 RepID=UPI002FF4327F
MTGEWGVGNGKWGSGEWEVGEQGSRGEVAVSFSPLPLCTSASYAQCPIPHAQCPIPLDIAPINSSVAV